MMTSGEVVAVLINERGFKTQSQFAERIGIAKSSLNRIIHGTKPLGKTNQKRIAQGLGLDLATFLFLINSGAPREMYKILLSVADLQNGAALTAIEKILQVNELVTQGKLPPEVLAHIVNQAETILKISRFTS